MASKNSKGFPPRTCAICHVKIRFQDRLCPQHLEEYKEDLTSPWLRGIIEYDAYAYRVELRDVGKVIALDRVSGKI
jgi:hypothetical protein